MGLKHEERGNHMSENTAIYLIDRDCGRHEFYRDEAGDLYCRLGKVTWPATVLGEYIELFGDSVSFEV
jgi:hypothetical protein